MKTYLLLGATLLSTQLLASEVRLTQLSGSYQDPSGQARASLVSLPDWGSFPNLNLEIHKVDEGYLFSAPEVQYVWLDPPSFMNDLISANWEGIQLYKNDSQIELSGQRLETAGADDALNLRNLALRCSLPAHTPDGVQEALLEGCLNRRGDLSAKLFELTSFKTDGPLKLFFQSFSKALLGGPIKPSSTDRYENVELSINGDNFEGQVTTKVVINATVKMNGKVYYEADQERVRVRIDRARAGFLNVLNMLFDELKAIESEKIRVEKPWITFDLSES